MQKIKHQDIKGTKKTKSSYYLCSSADESFLDFLGALGALVLTFLIQFVLAAARSAMCFAACQAKVMAGPSVEPGPG